MIKRLVCLVRRHRPVLVITGLDITAMTINPQGGAVEGRVTGSRYECDRCGAVVSDHG